MVLITAVEKARHGERSRDMRRTRRRTMVVRGVTPGAHLLLLLFLV
jgi:hypothetical protein